MGSLSALESSSTSDVPYYERYNWSFVLTMTDLRKLRDSYGILDSVVLEVPLHWAIDSEGFPEKVALTACALSHGLLLPFCRLVHGVLDYLKLAPAQLHSNAWRVLMCCCVVWRMVFEPAREGISI